MAEFVAIEGLVYKGPSDFSNLQESELFKSGFYNVPRQIDRPEFSCKVEWLMGIFGKKTPQCVKRIRNIDQLITKLHGYFGSTRC